MSATPAFRFFKDCLILINSGGLAGLLFMLVHLVLGRHLPAVTYASFVALMGLFSLLSVPASVISVVLARYVAEYAGEDTTTLWVTIVRRAIERVTLIGLFSLLLWICLSPWLKTLLNAPDIVSLIILGMIAFASLYSPVLSGTLQGAGLFKWMALSLLATAGLRLLLCSAVAFTYPTVAMLMVAVGLSALAGLLIAYLPLRRTLRRHAILPSFDTKPIYQYLKPVFVGQAVLFVIVNLDLITFVRFLDGRDLEAYGKVATLSRTILFLALPIATVMFPQAVRSARLRTLLGPFAFACITSLVATLFIFVFPLLALRVMYSIQDPYYADLLKHYVWAALPCSLCMHLSQYLWARHSTRDVLLLIPVLFLYLVAITLWHENAAQMIRCLTFASWGSLFLLAVATAHHWRQQADAGGENGP